MAHTTFRTPLLALAMATAALTILPGCAVTRGQSMVGEYIDDSTITAAVKSRFVSDKAVDAAAISVETLDGTVLLSGFAKNLTEKTRAEEIAQAVKGVKRVKNQITLQG